jgi:hypothetical protein
MMYLAFRDVQRSIQKADYAGIESRHLRLRWKCGLLGVW